MMISRIGSDSVCRFAGLPVCRLVINRLTGSPANRLTGNGFTLVELMVSVAVIAVGMVFVLGAFNQCMSSMTTADKTVTACSLLNAKMWQIDLDHRRNNGSEEGLWSGTFEDESHIGFNWTQAVRPVSQDFGNETIFVQESLNEEAVTIAWQQGKAVKDVTVTRFVKRKKE